MLLALLGAYYLNVLQLGDDMARALGLNIELARVLLTAVAALLAASSVSVAGLLGFVGLVVPHMVRLLVGTNYSRGIIPGRPAGHYLSTLSDTPPGALRAGRTAGGLIMAFIGALFLFLLRKEV